MNDSEPEVTRSVAQFVGAVFSGPAVQPPNWFDLGALCIQIGHEPFSPPDQDEDTHNTQRGQGFSYERARLICGRCPARSECLAFALDNDESSGMWGGATPDERRALLRGRVA